MSLCLWQENQAETSGSVRSGSRGRTITPSGLPPTPTGRGSQEKGAGGARWRQALGSPGNTQPSQGQEVLQLSLSVFLSTRIPRSSQFLKSAQH